MRASILLVVASLLSTISGFSAQNTVYLIRHGEKPEDDKEHGLSPQGLERAQCLRNVFGTSSGYYIDYIIAERPKSDGSRNRPLMTVQPLADDLGITVDTFCQRDDFSCVAKLVFDHDKFRSGNVLICWEHDALTDIVEALGDNDAPTYPDASFNYIWTDPSPYGAVTQETSEMCPGLDS
ncbi:hypothetical protein LHYA1_G002205 [Lachnellula hyalina]|uniref:Phosphoglycerate mutase family protein n=1 Tax=Lachnellula hyalina TaxID=1316788 RepID=A0A8H8R537_9HELO|nr:uncharacterized protein LHYA1_G002205 [Lachnellula hyalina]TVY28757.1 hypothetical protein LHYA1_G002205 [Lachnellula hyalina]